jgi:SAM-dependent methyltransferase
VESSPVSPDAIDWYNAHAEAMCTRYEDIPTLWLEKEFSGILPDRPALILDVGAGSGRDAAWLAEQGHEVVAVEPAEAMAAYGRTLHPSPRIRWIDERLPALKRVHELGLSFDGAILSAVWMHVPPTDRSRAFRKLVTLLKPGGFVFFTLRHGPSHDGRKLWPVSLEEIERLCRNHGLFVQESRDTADKLNRVGVTWTTVLVRLPDDGTGALPLIRHIILTDSKSSTYKLALLRVLSRIANNSLGLVRQAADESVQVPLGLVGLFWLRQFKPLLTADLPQSPGNVGTAKLGFVKTAYQQLETVSGLDLQIAARFTGSAAGALHQALKDVVSNLVQMPIDHTAYPKGNKVYGVTKGARVRALRGSELVLTSEYLLGFGYLVVPGNLWRALTRYNAWIEPALLAEWRRLMHSYAETQDRTLKEDVISVALRWADPQRDVRVAREIAMQLLAERKLFCVWTGTKLSLDTLDIDHCFPYSAWPCGDLWNLLPAHRSVNQREKKDRLPSADRFDTARKRITDWWSEAYLNQSAIGARFYEEANASLPGLSSSRCEPGAIFDGAELQRARLRQDWQLPEW